jgi:MFS family permease
LPAGAWAVPLGVILVSLCTGTLVTVVAALIGDWAVPSRQGLAVGALATAGDIGAAAGPLLAYPLAVVFDLRWVYLLCALALGSGLLVTLGRRSATQNSLIPPQ